MAHWTDFLSKSEKMTVARAQIVAAYDTYILKAGLVAKATPWLFQEEYNRGEIVVPDEARTVYPTVDSRCLRQWLALWRKTGSVQPNYRNASRKIEPDGTLGAALRSTLAEQPGIGAARLRQRLLRTLPADRVPSLRTLGRYLAQERSGEAT